MDFDARCRRYAGDKYRELRDVEIRTFCILESLAKTWQDLVKEVDTFAKEHPGCTLLCDIKDDYEYPRADIKAVRKETEEERENRFKKYAEYFEQQDRIRKAEYEVLKKEFEQ